MLPSSYILLLLFVLNYSTSTSATETFANPQPLGRSWEECSKAIELLGRNGNGTTEGSCMACSPTTDICASKCQFLIDAFYLACDGTYTPPGFYYDVGNTIEGEWNDKRDEILTSIQRCGCNSSTKVIASLFALLTSALMMIIII